MSSNHEHHDHDHHDHGHDHGGHDHDHSDESSPALQTLIYKQIEFDKIRTLNERDTDSGRRVVEKGWQDRLNAQPELVSDSDEQLLIYVPFAGVLKLHAILLRASTSASCPSTLKLFHNRDDLDFSTVSSDGGDLAPTQILHVAQTNDVQEIPVKRALFGNTYNLSLFVEDNHGDDDDEVTEIFYLGFKGEFSELNREPFEVLYEKAANPKDHELVSGIGERGGAGAMSGSGRGHGM